MPLSQFEITCLLRVKKIIRALPKALHAGAPITPLLLAYFRKGEQCGETAVALPPFPPDTDCSKIVGFLQGQMDRLVVDRGIPVAAYAFLEYMVGIPLPAGIDGHVLRLAVSNYTSHGGKIAEWPGAREFVNMVFKARDGGRLYWFEILRSHDEITVSPEHEEPLPDMIRSPGLVFEKVFAMSNASTPKISKLEYN